MEPDAPADLGLDDELVERVAGFYRVLREYCRVTAAGAENVPAGKALLVANHTGWAGLDYANLALVVRDDLARQLYTAVHPSYFVIPAIARLARRMGFFEAGVRESVRVLDRGELVLFFPEGEEGNFKGFRQLYQLQTFKPGFARAALAAAADIVPVTIVGGEEATPSLARLDFTKEMLGLGLPVPLTPLPLPVKWRITFHPPIPIKKYLGPDMADADGIEVLREEVEGTMRGALEREVEARGHPFF